MRTLLACLYSQHDTTKLYKTKKDRQRLSATFCSRTFASVRFAILLVCHHKDVRHNVSKEIISKLRLFFAISFMELNCATVRKCAGMKHYHVYTAQQENLEGNK